MTTKINKSKQTAEYWINTYKMEKHPEGGWYKEVFRSDMKYKKDENIERNISTGIVYLLKNDDISVFHKMNSEELWHYYDGNTNLRLHIIDKNGKYDKYDLGLSEDALPCRFVPKELWFGAELLKKVDSFVLCACTVSPGFDFRDFSLGEEKYLCKKYPEQKELIKRLTKL